MAADLVGSASERLHRAPTYEKLPRLRSLHIRAEEIADVYARMAEQRHPSRAECCAFAEEIDDIRNQLDATRLTELCEPNGAHHA